PTTMSHVIPSPSVVLWLLRLPPPRSTLFPYTTLFRSHDSANGQGNPHHIERAELFLEEARADDGTHGNHTNIHGREHQSGVLREDRKSTRLNSSHVKISYAVVCLKKKTPARCRTWCRS